LFLTNALCSIAAFTGNREAREKEEEERINKERPKIQDQFADLKRGLNTVSMDEWENLPEVGNIAGKNRKKANLRERFAPVPDSLLPRAQEEMATTLDAQVTYQYSDDL